MTVFDSNTNYRGNRLKTAAGILSLTVLAASLLYLSWDKWPDVLVDYGRELYVPWQILEGKVLYRDIHHLFGPFAPYFNAALFSLFGVQLKTLAVFNLACTAAVTVILGYLLLRMFGYLSAWAGLFIFIGVFAFGHLTWFGNYNYVCPYSHDALYGLELSCLMFVLVWRLSDHPRRIWMALLGVILGVILLTKVEIAVSAWVSALTILALQARTNTAYRSLRFYTALLTGIVLPLAIFGAYIAFSSDALVASKSLSASFYQVFTLGAFTNNVFYQHLSGLDQPISNLLEILRIGSYELIWAVTGISLCYLPRNWMRYVGLLLLGAITFLQWQNIPWFKLMIPLPVVLGILCLAWNIKKPVHSGFALFSLLLLLKMILNTHLYHYGFLLAMPGTVLTTGWLLSYPSRFWRLYVLLTLILFVGAMVQVSASVYSVKTFPVGEGRDRFYTYNADIANFGPVYAELLPWLEANVRPKQSIVTMPEGIMINYLARRVNSSGMVVFIPNMVESIGETEVIASLDRAKADYILIADKDTAENGARYFGIDYGSDIKKWITDNYETVAQFGSEPLTGEGFGVLVLMRKEYGVKRLQPSDNNRKAI